MRTTSSLPFWSAFVALMGAVVKQQHPDEPRPLVATPVPDPTPSSVEQLALAGCSDHEIAGRFLIDEAVLRVRFNRVMIPARALRCYVLRKAQFELATKGNGPMLTWLGRNELGQSLNPAQPGEEEPDMDMKPG